MNFRLNGINNQNFIMRDEETGTWWQQINGEAILGPLKGSGLKSIMHDEISFGIWKREKPNGKVLRPDDKIAAAGRYAPADWEKRIGSFPTPTQKADDELLEPRSLIVGIEINGESKAYPISVLERQRLIVDTIGGTHMLLVMDNDGKSVRGYRRTVDQSAPEFFLKTGSNELRMIDSETGSEWDFAGKAVSGPLIEKELSKILVLKDYWFDWKIYHPKTSFYAVDKP